MSNLSDDQSHLGAPFWSTCFFFLLEEPLDSPEVIISVIISGVKKKMPMEMTPNLFICNEKLNATGMFIIIITCGFMQLYALTLTF